MLAFFRQFGESRISKGMLGLLVVCFAAWGIGGYLTHFTGDAALSVNGEEISPQQVEMAYKQRLANVTRILGNISKEQIDQLGLPEQAVQDIVARTVMQQTARNLGLVAAVKSLQDQIAGMPVFADESGQFSASRYRAVLREAGQSPEQFERELGRNLAIQTMAQLIALEAPAPALAAVQASMQAATNTLEVATLTPADVPAPADPSESTLKAFYEHNSKVYTTPEKRDLAVLTLDRDQLAKTITVPEKDIEQQYNDNKGAYMVPEHRVVRHILLPSLDKAKEVRGKIHNLAEFEAAANTYSTDPGNKGGKGGLLGDITADTVVPAFSAVAFKLPVGQLSAPVQSPFGWHLIWVEKITPAKQQTLAEVHDQIAQGLREEQADDAMTGLQNQVDERIAGGSTLSEIAKKLGLRAHLYSRVGAKDESLPADVLAAGFGVDEGQVSAPVATKDGGSIYVQATKVYPAALPALDAVRARVASDWKAAQVQATLQGRAVKILAHSRMDHSTLQKAAQSVGDNGAAFSTLTLKTLSDAPRWLQPHLLEMLSIPVGQTLALPVPDGKDWHVVRVAARDRAPQSAEDAKHDAAILREQMQNDLENLTIGNLMQQARVEINQARMRQLFGKDVAWDLTGGE